MVETMRLCTHCRKMYDAKALWCPNCKGTTYWRVSVERDISGIITKARVLIEEGIKRQHGIRTKIKFP